VLCQVNLVIEVVQVDQVMSQSLFSKAYVAYLDLQVMLVILADPDILLLMARKVCAVIVCGHKLECNISN